MCIRSHFGSVRRSSLVAVAPCCEASGPFPSCEASWPGASFAMPSSCFWRFAAAEYDGVEYTETMSELLGIVFDQEVGYLAVGLLEQVYVDTGTSTHGHGGNRFEFYVWATNQLGYAGWIPDVFAPILAENFVIIPQGHPDLVLLAVAATGVVTAEAALASTAVASTAVALDESGPDPEITQDSWSQFFDC
jgi:hypothetical protein